MGILDRSVGFFRGMLQKSSRLPGTGAQPWLYGATVGLVHEPFAGAWQQGLTEAGAAGPNILAHSGVYACINVISSDISRLPLRVLRRADNGSREEFKKHYAWRLFRNPNSNQTSLQFVQNYLASKLIHGNTYVLLLRDARGVVNEMYVLDPNKVRPLIAEDGSVFYEVSGDELAGRRTQFGVPARDILHDRMAPFYHPLVGVSPIFAAGVSAMMGARIMLNSERFFANMSRAGGMLVAPGKIDKDVAKRYQDEWEKNYGPRGIGRTAVMGNGLDFKALTINATDAELVQQLRWTIEDVARVYRVPGYKLGDLNKVTYRNSEQMARDYFSGCLAYHMTSFEQCFKKSFEMPEDIDVEFDLRPLFRTETDTRFETYKAALNGGMMSINEVRAEEDLPPVKGGEEPRIQVQYVPLSQATGEGVNQPTPMGTPAVPGPAPAPAPKEPSGKSGPDQEITNEDVERIAREFLNKAFGVKAIK